MEFLILWLGTSITSFGMEIANDLRMFKDVADVGYKIDVKRLSEFNKQLNPNATKVTFLSMLIPIFNLMQVFQKVVQYNNIRPMILDQLSGIDSLEEMSEAERTEYLKKPNRLNALLIPLKSEIKLAKAPSIEINNGNEHSIIYYEIGKSFDDITILKVSGFASRLTVDEQKKEVVKAWEDVVQTEMEKYGDKEALINALNNTSLDLIDNKEDKNSILPSSQELNTYERKQALEELKSELLDEERFIQSIQVDKSPTLTKRRK